MNLIRVGGKGRKPNYVDLGDLAVLTGEREREKTLFILLSSYEEHLIMYTITSLSMLDDIGAGFQ